MDRRSFTCPTPQFLTDIRRKRSKDQKKFFETIKNTKASICGFGTISTVIAAAKKLGAKKAKLLKYATASEVAKIYSSTGYASIIIY